MNTSGTYRVRSFSVACFLIARGYPLLGAELDSAGVVHYRFGATDATVGLREYANTKRQLDDLADAVRRVRS